MRVVGIELPVNKSILIALTYIKGIGRTASRKILQSCMIVENTRVHELSEEQASALANFIETNYSTENNLRLAVNYDIKRMISIGCYKGIRHKLGLPVRGQSTQSNAKTAKKMKRNYVK